MPFVPQAIGIAIAQLFFRSALAVMYFGREANLIGYIALTYAAMRMMPDSRTRLTLALIALLPMSLYQAGSLSADGMTFAMAILVATAIWRMTFGEGPASKFDLTLLFVSTVCLSLTKLTYAPISLLVLMIPAKRWEVCAGMQWSRGRSCFAIAWRWCCGCRNSAACRELI